ncbi:MAG: radical SAM protein [Candidatus Binatia bacterium]
MSTLSAGVPHAISWNLTERCNLRCGHCYLNARARAGASDPSTRECLRVVDELAELNPNLFLILTGGEPLLRPDLAAVSRAAAAAGMTVVVGTNGTLLSARVASALRASGVQGVGISLDAAKRPDLHDQLRGRPGAWRGALAGLHAAREAGLDLAVQTSVFRWNRHEIAAIGELAAEFAAKAWNVYFLVCTGRGQALTDLTPEEYEAQLHELKRIQRAMSDRLFVAVRCAPQYGRVLAQEHSPAALVHAYPSGCPAGMHYARIGPAGEVTPCPYMPQVAGRLTEQSFREIWERSPLLLRLRDRSGLGGKCAMCFYRDRCGGCRARASASLGDAMAEDPSCLYQPDPASEKTVAGQPAFALPPECTMPWTAQARQRLERTPSFVRGLVVRRVEEEARRRGSAQVSADVMQAVRQRAMGTGAIAAVPRGTARHQPATSWSPAALARVEHAPNFVRPGIHKLMELRARERGVSEITSEFLSEIRDESMMRVAQIIRRFGLEEVRPAAFAEARRRMARKERKLLVLDQIEALLRGRSAPNREILDKFRRFMEAAPLRGRPWLPDAEARLDHLPAGRQAEARMRVENEAHRTKAPVVTRSLVEVVLARGSAGSSAGTKDQSFCH